MNLRYTALVGMTLVLLGAGCKPVDQTVAPISKIQLAQEYHNNFYKFSIRFPENTRYCLNDFCANDAQDHEISYINIPLSGSDHAVQVHVWRNDLGMSAVEYAKRSLIANRENRKDCTYSSESEVVFHGENSFQFVAGSCFEQMGLLTSSDAKSGQLVATLDSDFESLGFSTLLDVPHHVVYLDHNGNLFRIMYPSNNPDAQQIMETFLLN